MPWVGGGVAVTLMLLAMVMLLMRVPPAELRVLAAEGQERTNTPWVGRTGATQPTHRASGRSGTPRPLVRARPGCIGDHGKRHPEPWGQPVTGEPLHSPGGGHLPSRVAPQLKPQG